MFSGLPVLHVLHMSLPQEILIKMIALPSQHVINCSRKLLITRSFEACVAAAGERPKHAGQWVLELLV